MGFMDMIKKLFGGQSEAKPEGQAPAAPETAAPPAPETAAPPADNPVDSQPNQQ